MTQRGDTYRRRNLRKIAIVMVAACIGMAGCKTTKHTATEQKRVEIQHDDTSEQTKSIEAEENVSEKGVETHQESATQWMSARNVVTETYDSAGRLKERVTDQHVQGFWKTENENVKAEERDTSSKKAMRDEARNEIHDANTTEDKREKEDVERKTGGTIWTYIMITAAIVAAVMALKKYGVIRKVMEWIMK